MSLVIKGLLTTLLSNIVGPMVTSGDLEVFIQVAGLLIGAAIAWFGRYRHGDIEWWGGRK